MGVIDMMRHRIDEMHAEGRVDDIGKMSCSWHSYWVNKVSNVVGHRMALKDWCTNANRDLRLEVPELEQAHSHPHRLMGDIFEVLKEVKSDIAYFDPPYGTNNKNLVVSTAIPHLSPVEHPLTQSSPEGSAKPASPSTPVDTPNSRTKPTPCGHAKTFRLLKRSNQRQSSFLFQQRLLTPEIEMVYRSVGATCLHFGLHDPPQGQQSDPVGQERWLLD